MGSGVSSERKIPGDTFLFKQDPKTLLYTHCQICGKRRFDKTAVTFLSDEKLTLDEMKKVGVARWEYSAICNNENCIDSHEIRLGQSYSLDLLKFFPEAVDEQKAPLVRGVVVVERPKAPVVMKSAGISPVPAPAPIPIPGSVLAPGAPGGPSVPV